MSVKPNQKLF